MAAVAASGVIAMVSLTACGDDDKDKALIPPPKMPTFSAPSIDIPDMPSDFPTSTKKPSGSSTSKSTGIPTSGSTDDTSINRIDLKLGDCVDFDSTDKMSKTSCTGPHDAEAVGIYELPESMSPSSPTFENDIKEKCRSYVQPVIDRQPNASELAGTWIYPSVESWTMGDDKTLQCLVIRDDERPMPAGKLK